MTARYTRGTLAVAGLAAAASFLYAQTGTPLAIATDSLPPATVNTSYYQQLITTGGACAGNGASSGRIDSGALPPGLSLISAASAKQWYLQGTPFVSGDFSFTVHLIWTRNRVNPVDSNCTDEAVKVLTLSVLTGVPVQPSQTLTADRQQLTATYRIGHFPPASDTVNVTAVSGAAVAFSVQSSTTSGGSWLSVSPTQGTTPAALTVSYSVSGLTAGTYTGQITVTTTGTSILTVPVTLTVINEPIQLQAAPVSLAFTGVTGGSDPPGQTLKITVAKVTAPGDNVVFQAVVAAPPTGKWLTVVPSAAGTPATLTVAVASKDLAVGVYNGSLTVSVGGVPNSSLVIPVTFTVNVQAQKPVISAGGVINAASAARATAPGTWVSIFGTSLSTTTRAWRDSDFQNGALPTSLDGVTVTINGKSAAVAYVNPVQINVLAPDDTVTGLVPVVVKNALGTSDSALVLQQTAAPALFQFQTSVTPSYAAATHVDGSYVAGTALVKQGIPGTAAKAGETIVLFGTGFGATLPAISATAPVTAALPLARPEDLHIRIGSLDAVVAYAGLISPGVYQFNVVVPPLAAGDLAVVAELRGLLTQSGLLLSIQP